MYSNKLISSWILHFQNNWQLFHSAKRKFVRLWKEFLLAKYGLQLTVEQAFVRHYAQVHLDQGRWSQRRILQNLFECDGCKSAGRSTSTRLSICEDSWDIYRLFCLIATTLYTFPNTSAAASDKKTLGRWTSRGHCRCWSHRSPQCRKRFPGRMRTGSRWSKFAKIKESQKQSCTRLRLSLQPS